MQFVPTSERIVYSKITPVGEYSVEMVPEDPYGQSVDRRRLIGNLIGVHRQPRHGVRILSRRVAASSLCTLR